MKAEKAHIIRMKDFYQKRRLCCLSMFSYFKYVLLFYRFTIGKALKVPALIDTIIRKELFRSFVVESRSQQRHRGSMTKKLHFSKS
ncbi:hypothetical protein ACLIGD_08870 [Streptococcus equi subsp. zooepidemicus]